MVALAAPGEGPGALLPDATTVPSSQPTVPSSRRIQQGKERLANRTTETTSPHCSSPLPRSTPQEVIHCIDSVYLRRLGQSFVASQ
jgi:hypothetical protein